MLQKKIYSIHIQQINETESLVYHAPDSNKLQWHKSENIIWITGKCLPISMKEGNTDIQTSNWNFVLFAYL